ncbi:MAG: hypothetical protein EBR82_75085 [Caulobacteraceae bacterium]|nr:hypothetical protein [Caulobacteraceae bacterium]
MVLAELLNHSEILVLLVVFHVLVILLLWEVVAEVITVVLQMRVEQAVEVKILATALLQHP